MARRLRSTRLTLWTTAILALVVGGVAAVPASAATVPLRGVKWPGGIVRYYDASPAAYAPAVKKAVRQWNTSGLKIRFVAVRYRAAQVVVRRRAKLPDSTPGGSAGLATYGYLPGRGSRAQAFVYLDLRSIDPVGNAAVVTHEFGHVLGLGHPRAGLCSVMKSPIVFAACPKPADGDYETCDFVRALDRKAVARRYGHRGRRSAKAAFCPRGPAPAVPANPPGLAFTLQPAGTGVSNVVFTWTPYADAKYRRMEITIFPGTCAAPDRTRPNAGMLDPPLGTFTFSNVPSGDVSCWEFVSRSYNPFFVVSDKFGLPAAVQQVEVRVP